MTVAKAATALPPSCPPRGLSRAQAAAYVGVGVSLFETMVEDGRMPQPKRINSRTVWDRVRLDEAFDALPDSADRNPWDDDPDAGPDAGSAPAQAEEAA